MRYWILLLFLAGCRHSDVPASFEWNLPASLPLPDVPIDNPMTAEKVALGRQLFYEPRLSGNKTYSCSTCHHQRFGFTDGMSTPYGSTGDAVARSAMSLTNVAYGSFFTWSHPDLTLLEEQIRIPALGDTPAELGMSEKLDEILARLSGDAGYQQLFHDAFPKDANPFGFDNIARAITSFERTILSGNSPYDRYQAGDRSALSDAAVRGMNAFFGEKLECYHCHAGVNFTTAFRALTIPQPARDMHNTGLYNVDGKGSYPPNNTGLYEFTGFANDMGKFKVPTLRNVALTAPYFHDGSAATLGDVVDLYSNGGRVIASGPLAGDGRTNIHRDPLVRPFELSDDEKADVIAFLTSLSDDDYVTNPKLSNPNCPTDLPTSCMEPAPSYAAEVAPIVTHACGACHRVGGTGAQHLMDSEAKLAALARPALGEISDCSMPPAHGQTQLSDSDRALLMNWLLCGANTP